MSRRGIARLPHLLATGVGLAAIFLVSARATDLQVLDRVTLARDHGAIKVNELSGLAWDADENMLFAVSDRGHLLRFDISLKARRLNGVKPLSQTQIRGGDAASLKNAEALAVAAGRNGSKGDSSLLIGFEDGPAIERFSTDGKRTGSTPLWRELADKSRYDGDNNRLEAVSFSDAWGIITAPEKPLLGVDRLRHQIFHAQGALWSLPRSTNSSIKALELLPNGNLLVLERLRGENRESRARLSIVLTARCAGRDLCEVIELGSPPGLDESTAFEGMTWLEDDLFLLVNDVHPNDGSPTQFVLISITHPAARQP